MREVSSGDGVLECLGGCLGESSVAWETRLVLECFLRVQVACVAHQLFRKVGLCRRLDR